MPLSIAPPRGYRQALAAREIAELIGVSRQAIIDRASAERWPYKPFRGNGGLTHIYRVDDLPPDIRRRIFEAQAAAGSCQETGGEQSEKLRKQVYETASYRDVAEGRRRAAALARAVKLAERERISFRAAARTIAEGAGLGVSSFQRWHRKCEGQRRQDWPLLLAAKHGSGRRPAEIPDAAWRVFQDEYLRFKGPSLSMAYERVVAETASECPRGLPSLDTFARRLRREYTEGQIILAREGTRAVAQLHPRIEVDRSELEAGKHVSADGVKFDSIWVDWGDGKPVNTSTGWFFCDMRTGFPMAYRLAPSETTTLIRLSSRDLFKEHGIPDGIQVDSTMAVASKVLTGRAERRPYRGKARPDDPIGLLVELGIDVMTTKPPGNYNQAGSKLIERFFGTGGIHARVRQHPLMKGRGASKKSAVSHELLRKVVALALQEHVAKPGRRGQSCDGKSLEQAYLEARESVVVREATDEELDLMLLEVKRVRVTKRKGEISIQLPGGKMARHYYWDPSLLRWRGKDVYAYYRPDNMKLPVRVVDIEGNQICAAAAHRPGAKFGDKEAGQKFAKQVRRWVKSERESLAAKREMNKIERRVYRELDATDPKLPALGIAAAGSALAEVAVGEIEEPLEAISTGIGFPGDMAGMRQLIREAEELNQEHREAAAAPLEIPAWNGGGNE